MSGLDKQKLGGVVVNDMGAIVYADSNAGSCTVSTSIGSGSGFVVSVKRRD